MVDTVGVRQEAFTVQAISFIKQNYLDDPANNPFQADTVFTGDERLTAASTAIFDPASSNYRTRQVVTISPIDVLQDDAAATVKTGSGHTPAVGVSEKYDKASSVAGGRITNIAKADLTLNDGIMKIASAVAPLTGMKAAIAELQPRVVELQIDSEAANPLKISPEIDFHVGLSFDYTDPLNPVVEYNIVHDGFPCYELNIDGTIIYSFDSGTATPWSLFGHGDVSTTGAKTLPKPERLP